MRHAVCIKACPHGSEDADRLLEPRRTHLIPEALIHAPEHQDAALARVRIGLDGFWTVLRNRCFEVVGNRIEGFIPSDALELGAWSPRTNAPMRIKDTTVVVDQL